MPDKPTILVHLDTDASPSVFDRVVAVDSGADHVFSYGGVTPERVMPLVHGCIFTRGSKDLHRTAIFVGGSDITAAEAVFAEVRKHLLPQLGLTVSVMLDPNGANTTAAAAVWASGRHLSLGTARSLVLGSGPVGMRVARLLARLGGDVRIGSRQPARDEEVCSIVRAAFPGAKIEAVPVTSKGDGPKALDGRDLVVAAGTAGICLLPKPVRASAQALKVAVDLNAVPPAGIEGIELTDRGQERDGVIGYGALGVGSTKMKVHKAAVAELFRATGLVLDADEIYDLASGLA